MLTKILEVITSVPLLFFLLFLVAIFRIKPKSITLHMSIFSFEIKDKSDKEEIKESTDGESENEITESEKHDKEKED